jgi:hypothetical protein
VVAVTEEATRLPEIRNRADPREHGAPCPRCNISFVPFEGNNFGLALQPARCKFVTDRGTAFSKQSILRNPARPAERECSVDFSVSSLKRSLMMRSPLVLAAICFSATAFAQSAPPKVGNKSLVQVKPKEPMGCKLVGTVRGTKLWAGNCVGSELRGPTTTTERQGLPEQAAGATAPDQSEDHPRPSPKGNNSLKLSA